MKELNEKPITTELFNRIKKVGVLSGSRLFCDKKGKDVDTDVLIEKNEENNKLLSDLWDYTHYEQKDYFDTDSENFYSLYCNSPNNNLINLIVCKTQETFDARVYATEMIVKLKKSNEEYAELLKDKTFRVAQYRLFRDYFLGELAQF